MIGKRFDVIQYLENNQKISELQRWLERQFQEERSTFIDFDKLYKSKNKSDDSIYSKDQSIMLEQFVEVGEISF